jgi:hypothetical protein
VSEIFRREFNGGGTGTDASSEVEVEDMTFALSCEE